VRASWFETRRCAALLTMRLARVMAADDDSSYGSFARLIQKYDVAILHHSAAEF